MSGVMPTNQTSALSFVVPVLPATGTCAPTSFRACAPQRQWTVPPDLIAVELDRATGLPVDSSTPPERRYTEYFMPGTEPEPLRSNPWKLPRWGAVLGTP
jgi:hypothetical protein